MKLVTANIKCNPQMRQSSVDSDVGRVRTLGGVILWQEIAIQRYKDSLHEQMPRREHVALGTETPITYKPWIWHAARASELPDMRDAPKDLFPKGVRATGAIRMHGGRSHVTPARYVVYAILVRPGVPPVVYMNTHMISGAWSNKHLLTRKWRRAQWNIHFAKQKRIVNYFVGKGLTVVGGGDTNRGTMAKYHPDQRWLAHGGIDHLYSIRSPRGGARLTLNESHTVHGLHTDHDPRVATIHFRPA